MCRSPEIDASPTEFTDLPTRQGIHAPMPPDDALHSRGSICPFHPVLLYVVDVEHSAGQLPAGLANLLARLEDIRCLRLFRNDFVEPPEALVATGMHAVKTYYMDLFAEGSTVERRDVKVVVVGMAGAGKTR